MDTPLKYFTLERLQHVRSFLVLLFSRFMANNSLQNAGAMTYTTLLSLVPLMAVVFALFSFFPIGDTIQAGIQQFVFSNFVPASGDVLQSYFDGFTRKAAKMTGTSFVFLILVALMLMASVDRAFNTIWRVKRKRGTMKMFMVYWSVLSLGPMLIALSIAVTSYIVSLPLISEASGHESISRLFTLTPVLVSSFAFMLLYAVIPNRTVPLKHAFSGGLVAAVLFEIAKRTFAFYVTNFPTYEAIYGALATVPIFLVWLYISWLITLLGAEFTYCLSIYRRQKKHFEWHGDKLLDVIEILGLLWQAQIAGRSLSLEKIADEVTGYTEERLENLLLKLKASNLVLNTDRYEWALGRDLGSIRLLDLYHMQPLILPLAGQIDDYNGVAKEQVAALMYQIVEADDAVMDITMEDVFSSKILIENRL